MKAGSQCGSVGRRIRRHTGFFRRSAAFLVIAPEAGSDDIVPSLLSARGDRHDVIERQVLRREFLSAVLTRVIVARVDVGPGKLHSIVVLHADVLQQTNDRRKLDRESDGVNLLLVLLNDFNFSGNKQRQRFFPGNNP